MNQKEQVMNRQYINKDLKLDPRDINLFQIDVVESSIQEASRPGDQPFNVELAHTMMHSLESQKIKISLHVHISMKSNPDKMNARFVIDFHFQIKNLNDFYELKEYNQAVFSNLLISTLLGISFSTARGIVFERLSNTKLGGVILPAIDAQALLKMKWKV